MIFNDFPFEKIINLNGEKKKKTADLLPLY